jgi:hypothetical protein
MASTIAGVSVAAGECVAVVDSQHPLHDIFYFLPHAHIDVIDEPKAKEEPRLDQEQEPKEAKRRR